MLDELATITGSFIYFKGDIPHLKYITDTNETIDETYLCQDDVIIGKKYFINSLVFSRAEESDNIYRKDDTSITQNGLHEFRISDNQILSTLERDTFIDELFNYLKTLEFYIFDVKSTGIMWFEVADKFTISAHNNTYPVVLLNDEITVDQDIEEHLFSDEPEETQTKYKYADETDRRINQAYILVDKQNQKITQLTKETTENSQKLTKQEQDINGVTTKVSSVETQVTNITNTQGEAEGKNIHIEDSAEEPFVDISLQGESTQNGTLTPENKVDIENIEGNIEFKVEGKNRFNGTLKSGLILAADGKTYVTNNNYVCSENYIEIEGSKTYTILNKGKLSGIYYVLEYDVNKNFIKSSNSSNSNSFSVTVSSNCKFIRVEIGSSANPPTIETLQDFQIEEGLTATEYEPHKSQVATFTLGEEKLMEGSYLADDGIHHSRKQIVFDGSDDENWTTNGTKQGYGILIDNVGGNAVGNVTSSVLCDKLTAVPQNTIYNGSAINGVASFGGTTHKLYVRFDSTITSVALLKEKLSQNPITVEYDLAEPEVVPYTAEQQEAWNKIKALMTYKNITNITSDAYAKVIYMRDNGLDVYETKQNAEKNYTETTKKLAEQKITVDEISQEVTNVNENLKGNYYTKTETNSKINEKADSITSEVSKTYSTKTETETAKTEAINSANSSTDNKLNDYTETSKLGTFIEQNYEHVKIAWNQISEFIQMMILNSNASLAILDGSKKPLMALDKTGMHFYNFSEQEIGNIGINNAEISFYINGDVSGSSMSWGICKTVNGEKKYFQVFSYEGYNTEEGTEFGGKFLLEAPLIMQENTLFLGQSINSSYIQGQETDGRKKTTIGNTDDLYIYNTNGDLIFVLNSSYLKLYEQLEMYADPLATGGYAFNLMDNTLVGIDSISASGEISSNNGTFNDIPNSDNVRRFNNTGTDYLIAVLKSSAGGGSIYCQNANSDKKFKKNIKDTEIKALDIIKQIQHRQFDWKENGKHEKIGFIAQELEKINPCLINVIKENDEKTYLLNEKAILATVTKAIQEQQKEIEDLKKEIEKLKENKIEEV